MEKSGGKNRCGLQEGAKVITVDFKRLNIKPGFKILDIGCGPGRHTCAAYEHQKVTVVGADLSLKDLKEAKSRLNFHDSVGAHGNGAWALSTADVTRLPFKDASFDLVICSEVMEHIPDHEIAAGELLRVLKPGMNLVVSVPRFFPEKICWALSDEYYNANQGHVRIYKKKEIVKMIKNSGAMHFGSHWAHSIHTPYWWLKCLVGPTRTDSGAVNLYHRFLTWDIMKKPVATRFADRLLNPLMGKSIVLYFRKQNFFAKPPGF